MDYTAVIEIRVFGAEAADRTYLDSVCDQIIQYLSFEGEHVEVGLGVDVDEGSVV